MRLRLSQSHSVLRKYGISRLFFPDPVRLGNRTIGVNLGIFRSLFEFAKGCVFSCASLESASIFK